MSISAELAAASEQRYKQRMEIIHSLVDELGLGEQEAFVLVDAIEAGRIKHVSIRYWS